jgi:glutamate formiminotransferase
VLECVPNVSEGRDARVLETLASACGASLLDVHRDRDHHRSVFTLAGPGERDAVDAVRDLARAVARTVDVSGHRGVHPRLGALDVVPFVALDGAEPAAAVTAARELAAWIGDELAVPVFLYGDADPDGRTLPEARRDAFRTRPPDRGPGQPHSRLGACAVGARPVLVAVNCELASNDLELARGIASEVRERDGGLPGVRALGLALASVRRVQVSMNLIALDRTGCEDACTAVRRLAERAGSTVVRVELVGLLPAAELARCSPEFLAWSGLSRDVTIESRLARRGPWLP